jgi:hypothetical protein
MQAGSRPFEHVLSRDFDGAAPPSHRGRSRAARGLAAAFSRVQGGVRLGPEASELLGRRCGKLGVGDLRPGPAVAVLGSSRLAHVKLAHREDDPPARPVERVRLDADGLLKWADGLGVAGLTARNGRPRGSSRSHTNVGRVTEST